MKPWIIKSTEYSDQLMPSNAHVASSSPQRGCVPATATIWGCSTGMLAIDLLLSTSAQSGTAIAIAIVTAAAVSTMTVWLSARQPTATKAEAVVPDQA